MNNFLLRLQRRLYHSYFVRRLRKGRWDVLRGYPHVVPSQSLLDRWNRAEWPDYQKFINRQSIITVQQWRTLHQRANQLDSPVKISIVTPVYNTRAAELRECILSVRLQTYPWWELVLVDDASSSVQTRQVLRSSMCRDPRIRIFYTDDAEEHGISAATNRAIAESTGDYLLFLDHDDRLALDALQAVAHELKADPFLDLVYSDRDMLSPGGRRFMHLCKPAWSPETLLSCNYIVHLMCFRKALVKEVGGLRSEFDGSQDYDLILRCTDRSANVRHIPAILYHWRQTENSVALSHTAKKYAYQAAVKGIQESLRRRKIDGTVKEYDMENRGYYQVILSDSREAGRFSPIIVDSTEPERYVECVRRQIKSVNRHSPLFLQAEGLFPLQEQYLEQMASWLQVEGIGMVSGRVIDAENRVVYAGITYGEKGEILRPYAGRDADEPGYLAATMILRNISGPDPYCVMIRGTLWQELLGLDGQYVGPYGLFDFALRALEAGYRILYLPLATFRSVQEMTDRSYTSRDVQAFRTRWQGWLERGDPYYSPNLSRKPPCYELETSPGHHHLPE